MERNVYEVVVVERGASLREEGSSLKVGRFCSGIILSLLLFYVTKLKGETYEIAATASIAFLTGFFWITEALPFQAVSFLPFILFPVMGVLSYKEASASLGNPVIILLMGAFMLSKAIERTGVERRLAFYAVRYSGAESGRQLLFTFLPLTALFSMWISNTATTLMMVPIAMVLLRAIDDRKLASRLLLAIAYGSSLGGICTPVGTPPNLICTSIYEEVTGRDIGFLSWMLFSLPILLLALPFTALWLSRGLTRFEKLSLPDIGEWRAEERRVLLLFTAVIVCWVSRNYWSGALHMEGVGDSTIALCGLFLLFVIDRGGGERGKLLDWKRAKEIDWGLLLLFGAGICIAKAFLSSGLAEKISLMVASIATLPLPLLLLLITLFVSFLTEVTSNTATATLLMPILASAAIGIGQDPKLLMVPAAISSSCAFMLPVATAPNAIVYSTGSLTIREMAREGFAINLFTAVVIALTCWVTLA